jgi:hypothetical protein
MNTRSRILTVAGALVLAAVFVWILSPSGDARAQQSHPWGEGSGSAIPDNWMNVSAYTTATDGVSQSCEVWIGPILRDSTGANVRPVAMFTRYSMAGMGHIASASTAGTLSCQGSEPATTCNGTLIHGDWTGTGKHQAVLSPVSGRTWATVRSKDDVQVVFSLLPD